MEVGPLALDAVQFKCLFWSMTRRGVTYRSARAHNSERKFNVSFGGRLGAAFDPYIINKCNIYIHIYTECFNVAVSDISGSASCSDSDVDFFGPFERGETSPSPPDEDA